MGNFQKDIFNYYRKPRKLQKNSLKLPNKMSTIQNYLKMVNPEKSIDNFIQPVNQSGQAFGPNQDIDNGRGTLTNYFRNTLSNSNAFGRSSEELWAQNVSNETKFG